MWHYTTWPCIHYIVTSHIPRLESPFPTLPRAPKLQSSQFPFRGQGPFKDFEMPLEGRNSFFSILDDLVRSFSALVDALAPFLIPNVNELCSHGTMWKQAWWCWTFFRLFWRTFLHFVKIETSTISYSWNIFSPQVSFFCPFYRFNDLQTFLGMKFDLKILLCAKEFDIFATLGKHVPHLHWYASAALNGS